MIYMVLCQLLSHCPILYKKVENIRIGAQIALHENHSCIIWNFILGAAQCCEDLLFVSFLCTVDPLLDAH